MAEVEYKATIEVTTGNLKIEVEGNDDSEVKLTWRPGCQQKMTIKDAEKLRDLLRAGISAYERSTSV